MTIQSCPSCARAHPVSSLREGAEVPCACGAHFTVRASPAHGSSGRTAPGPTQGPSQGSTQGSLEGSFEGTHVAAPVVAPPGYSLEHVLGRGGMGEVWLARQHSLGRRVAVKILPPRLAKDPEFVRRFDKEATALASLSHPNIVQIIDRGVADEHYYFVMEYVEGRSLREVMRELSPPEALRVALQMARALESAHERGIIHRDLKPENVLLDGRGHVKVADFGLAGIRRADSGPQLTATSVAMGTLNYMAPEQRRDAKSVDGRADLFSLGVVLYEMLTGELPVGRFRPPSARLPGLDPRVDTVVERLLENDPGTRLGSAHQLCESLEALVTSVSTSAASSPSSPGLGGATLAASPATGARGRLRSGWRPVRAALTVLGAVVAVFWGLRSLMGAPLSVPWGEDTLVFGGRPVRVVPGSNKLKPWPTNTEADIFVGAVTEELADGRVRLGVDFVPGAEKINAHAGTWELVDGHLHALQGGNDASGGQLIPRAYLAHRYFSSDDFSAEAVMSAHSLGRGYPEDAEAQHYAELSFRVTGLQVSIYAIPGVGMRLSWRYTTADGREVVGNSSQEVADLVQDETPVPQGSFRVKLQLKRRKGGGGVEVDAYLNGAEEPFAHKFLEGLQGRSAKIAMGCRNLECTFDDLVVRGLQGKKAGESPVAETRQE